jgi:integrative and conjugative element protein (TIGR02256 family)
VLSGIAARALRTAATDENANAWLWSTDEHLAVTRRVLHVGDVRTMGIGEWTVVVDERATHDMHELRRSRLPNETGGVLYGARDLSRRIIYVVGIIPSPSDSTEWPTLYIRGAEGLKAKVDRIERISGGSLGYLGEWHSHPDGATVHPSVDDRTVFEWLASFLVPDGYPALMAIIGERGDAWFVGSI